MFRKLVSSLPFSPALVGQLGFYARRLSREQATRRLGVIFTVLALVIQCFALFNPPEPTFAAAPSSACQFNSSLTGSDPNCRPCRSNANLWINDPGCNKNLQLSAEVTNLSQSGKSAIGGIIHPSDRLQYTIRTTNMGSSKTAALIELSIKDITEYATLTDGGGGAYDSATQRLSWGSVSLAPGQTDTRSLVVTVSNTLPATPQTIDNPSSYDCTLTLGYGNTLDNALSCPIGKEVEGVIKQLPQTGMTENVLFSTLLLMTVTYFYARARQTNREMKLIRRDFNVG